MRLPSPVRTADLPAPAPLPISKSVMPDLLAVHLVTLGCARNEVDSE
jgi:hypothetical protein